MQSFHTRSPWYYKRFSSVTCVAFGVGALFALIVACFYAIAAADPANNEAKVYFDLTLAAIFTMLFIALVVGTFLEDSR